MFANGAATAAFIALASEAANGSSDIHNHSALEVDENGVPIPEGPYDVFDEDKAQSLGLTVDTNEDTGEVTVSGVVKIRCERSMHCGEAIQTVRKNWNGKKLGKLTLNVDAELVNDDGPTVLNIYKRKLGRGGLGGLNRVSSKTCLPLFGCSGKGNHIILNSEWMDGNTAYHRQITISHEFGHAIGFSHRANPTNSLMSYSKNKPLSLSQEDADAYF